MVENQGVYIGVFIAVTALMILVGIWASRKVKSGDDFLMGGRNLPLPLLIGTTVATLVGTGSSMGAVGFAYRSEEHTSELQSRENLVCRLLLEKKKRQHARGRAEWE